MGRRVSLLRATGDPISTRNSTRRSTQDDRIRFLRVDGNRGRCRGAHLWTGARSRDAASGHPRWWCCVALLIGFHFAAAAVDRLRPSRRSDSAKRFGASTGFFRSAATRRTLKRCSFGRGGTMHGVCSAGASRYRSISKLSCNPAIGCRRRAGIRPRATASCQGPSPCDRAVTDSNRCCGPDDRRDNRNLGHAAIPRRSQR